MTKGEKLRSMTDNQIAHYVVDKYHVCPSGILKCADSCYRCWREYLKSASGYRIAIYTTRGLTVSGVSVVLWRRDA